MDRGSFVLEMWICVTSGSVWDLQPEALCSQSDVTSRSQYYGGSRHLWMCRSVWWNLLWCVIQSVTLAGWKLRRWRGVYRHIRGNALLFIALYLPVIHFHFVPQHDDDNIKLSYRWGSTRCGCRS